MKTYCSMLEFTCQSKYFQDVHDCNIWMIFHFVFLVGLFSRNFSFLNATFCNIPYPVTYLLSNAWPWKTTEEINIVFICLSVGIFKCNEPLLQINYTRHMDHRSLLCMSPNQIFPAISKLVLSVYLTSCKRGHRSDHLDNQLQAQQYSCSIAENCQTSHL